VTSQESEDLKTRDTENVERRRIKIGYSAKKAIYYTCIEIMAWE
jgi:hypothetical protein